LLSYYSTLYFSYFRPYITFLRCFWRKALLTHSFMHSPLVFRTKLIWHLTQYINDDQTPLGENIVPGLRFIKIL